MAPGRKPNIQKIIESGTAKQRVELYATHFASVATYGPGILSGEQIEALHNTLKSDKDVELYNTYNKIDRKIRNSLAYLLEWGNGYREQVAHIQGISRLLYSLWNIAGTLTSIISLIEDKTFSDYVAKEIENIDLLGARFIVKDGEVILETGEEDMKNGLNWLSLNEQQIKDLWEGKVPPATRHLAYLYLMVKQYRKNAENDMRNAKTLILALREYMGEIGYNIKPYKRHLDKIEAEFRGDKSIFTSDSKKKLEKWIGVQMDLDIMPGGGEFLFPDYDSLEPKLNDLEYYRREFNE